MVEQPMPFVTVVGEGRAVRAGQQLRVPVTFERPLLCTPRPLTVLWTDLINCQYMGIIPHQQADCKRPGSR